MLNEFSLLSGNETICPPNIYIECADHALGRCHCSSLPPIARLPLHSSVPQGPPLISLFLGYSRGC